MKRKIVLTCAVTGSGALGPNSTHVPVTPQQIADEAISAASAGASAVHIHVRNPETGAPSMDLELYRAVVDRIRASPVDMILNLTTGVGASHEPAVEENGVAVTSVVPPGRRTRHVVELKPEVCTLDVATMNFANHAIVNTPTQLRLMSEMIQSAGVKPELEVFDLGHVDLAKRLLAAGHLPAPPFFQLCLGVAGGAPATPEGMLMMRSLLPPDTLWSAFGIGRFQMPMVAQSVILGGHCRVGLEDNLYLEYGVLAKGNAPLVERAVTIIEALGCSVATPSEARELLTLPATPIRSAA